MFIDVTRCPGRLVRPRKRHAAFRGVCWFLLVAGVFPPWNMVFAQAGALPEPEPRQSPHVVEQDMDPLETGSFDRFFSRVRQRNAQNERLVEAFNVSPVLGGLHTGAGTTAGLQYEPFPAGDQFYIASAARVSLRGYWGIESLLGYENAPYVTYGYARYRHLPQEDYYGLGPNTPVDRHTTYRQDELLVGVLAGLQTDGGLFTGAHVSYLENRIGRGHESDVPQVYDIFDAADVPGGFPGVSYMLAGVWLEYDSRNLPPLRAYGSRFAPGERRLHGLSLDARRGFNASAEYRHYLDIDGGAYGFSRLILEAQQYLPLFNARHVLALRTYGSFSRPADGEVIPFYMMQALGGQRSLRGFGTYRFRDMNVALLNAEYRFQLWPFLQLAAFADAGHVFPRFAAINKDDLEASHGAGIRFQFGGRTLIRFDVTRSREGIGTHVSVGSFL